TSSRRSHPSSAIFWRPWPSQRTSSRPAKSSWKSSRWTRSGSTDWSTTCAGASAPPSSSPRSAAVFPGVAGPSGAPAIASPARCFECTTDDARQQRLAREKKLAAARIVLEQVEGHQVVLHQRRGDREPAGQAVGEPPQVGR